MCRVIESNFLWKYLDVLIEMSLVISGWASLFERFLYPIVGSVVLIDKIWKEIKSIEYMKYGNQDQGV